MVDLYWLLDLLLEFKDLLVVMTYFYCQTDNLLKTKMTKRSLDVS